MTREQVIDIYNKIHSELLTRPLSSPYTYTRFNYCNAYIGDDLLDIYCDGVRHTIRLIKSYNTIVGFADISTATFCEIGKFSRTTSKQCTQIYNTYYRGWDRINANHYVCY